jgi:hypothetical protein
LAGAWMLNVGVPPGPTVDHLSSVRAEATTTARHPRAAPHTRPLRRDAHPPCGKKGFEVQG